MISEDFIIAALAPELQPLVRELLLRARAAGLDCLIPSTGGARSAAEQMRHFAQGRHHDDTGRWAYDDPVHHAGVVTNALPDKSPHCHRGAVDIELREDGRVLTLGPELDPQERARQLTLYCQLGAIGEQLGLVWGGRFKAIHDYDHVEHPAWRTFPLAT